MRITSILPVCLLAFLEVSEAATAEEWRSKPIYQIMTDRYALTNGSTTSSCDPALGLYCGGTWKGIEERLDYVQNMGFGGIWISPITAQLPQHSKDLSSYHGYWQQNIYALNDRFGTEQDLHDLSNAVHARGMYFMVDIVVNHMAWAGDPSSVQYDRLIPFGNSSYYHDYCPINGTSTSTQQECWLGDDVVSLPDLRTEDSDVQSIFNTWISTLVSDYNIDGLRLDSVVNVNPSFFSSFCAAAGIFCIGEAYSGNSTIACPYQEEMDGIMNYPMFFPITRALQSTDGNFDDVVAEFTELQDDCKDTTLLGSFSENHDQPRFASYTSDMSLAKNVITYTILSDGIPVLYQGQEQHLSGGSNPMNREALWLTSYPTDTTLYNQTSSLNIIRSLAINSSSSYLTTTSTILKNTTNVLVLRKENVITLLNNLGSSSPSTDFSFSLSPSESSNTSKGTNTTAMTNWTKGTIFTEVISCSNHTVNDQGGLDIQIQNGLPMVFMERTMLMGSTVCGGGVEGGVTWNNHPVSMDPPPPSGKKSGGVRLEKGGSLMVGLLVVALWSVGW